MIDARAGSKCLVLGTSGFGSRVPERDAAEMIAVAIENGVMQFDTADIYGESEFVLGRALKADRQRVFIATKFGSGAVPGEHGGQRSHIVRVVEQSLRRLRTTWVDLLQIHEPDVHTPIEETVAALDELIRAGKVRYFGTCNHAAPLLARALAAATPAARPRTEQSCYNLLERQAEEALLPLCQREGVGFFAWSPLGGGLLGGRYTTVVPRPEGSRRVVEGWLPWSDIEVDRKLQSVERLAEAAKERGESLASYALLWVLSRPGVSGAIVGPRNTRQLLDLIEATHRQESHASMWTCRGDG